MAEQENQRMYDNDELNLLDYCRVIWKRRGLIAALCIGSVLISAVYSLWMPKMYRATVTIMPPKQIGVGVGSRLSVSGGGGTGGGLLGSTGLLSSFFSVSNPTEDYYKALLTSRVMREEVLEHFKKKLGPRVDSIIGKMSLPKAKKAATISLTVEVGDPKLAAEVANYYFENLASMLARRAKTKAELERQYYLRHLDQARQDLKGAQDLLIDFQEEHRIMLDPATRRAIAAQAVNAGSVMALEMERNIKRMYLTDQHPEMIALNRRIYESKKLVSHQLYGDPQPLPPESPGAPPRQEFFVAKTKMTPLQFKLMDVYRELTFRQAVENSIHQNIESLKYGIDNPASIYIDWLDRAIPPGGPFRPITSYNIAAAGVGSLIIGILLALFLEYIERIRVLEQRRQQTVNSK